MKKRIRLSLLFGIMCAVFISMTQFNVLCDDLRENVLRLHIIANSDSAEDQALKLKIRDEILAESGNLFVNSQGLEKAEEIATQNIDKFKDIAERVIEENGFNQKVEVSLGDSFFETRHYDNFSLPAGTYRSLIIKLGEAEGKNWWCVIFPSICIPTATEGDLRDSVSEQSAQIAEQSEKYIVKFKTVEIYEKIKNWFS